MLSLPAKGAEPCEYGAGGRDGFRRPLRLEKALFDVPPRLRSLSANLFRLVQRQTKVLSVPLNGGSSVELQTDMADFGNIFVYCREEKGGPYRASGSTPAGARAGAGFTRRPCCRRAGCAWSLTR